MKLQEITDKIYREGVEKGNETAEKIISEANVQKAEIITEAENEAKQIIAQAQKQAIELKKNTESELKMFASQAVEALKSEIVNLVTDSVISKNVKAASTDPAFMKEVILNIATSWAEKESLTIAASEETKLSDYFKANAKDLLNKGVKIESVSGKTSNFTIIPADGSYKVSFGEEEFIAYFKQFLRPKLVETLF